MRISGLRLTLVRKAADRRREDTLLIGASLLLVGLFAAGPSWASVTVCSKNLSSESAKLQSAALKRFQKCNDLYRKDVKTPTNPPFAKAAPGCEKELEKLFDPVTGQIAKSLAKLNGFVPKTCGETDLRLLGHLPPSIFGDRWQRYIAVTSVQAAYELEITAVRDLPEVFQDLAGTGNCAACEQLATPPCLEQTCNLGSGTVATTFSRALPPLTLEMKGVIGLKLCRLAGVTRDNEYTVAGPIARTLAPARIPQVGYLCVAAIAGEGYVNCNGTSGPGTVNSSSCQDHVLAQSTGTCAESPCEPSTADNGYNGTSSSPGLGAHPGVTNGGECIALNTNDGVNGGAFINSTFTATVVLNSQVGADGKPCTADDTAAAGQPITGALTTGIASAKVQDADTVPFATLVPALPVTGSPFDCSALARGSLSGGALVEAFPLLHGIIGLDSVTTITFACK